VIDGDRLWGLLYELGEIGEGEGGGATQLSCNTGADVLYSTLLKLANGAWPLSRIALLP
jgi:hypothetical protein